jgi:hypothetical protein
LICKPLTGLNIKFFIYYIRVSELTLYYFSTGPLGLHGSDIPIFHSKSIGRSSDANKKFSYKHSALYHCFNIIPHYHFCTQTSPKLSTLSVVILCTNQTMGVLYPNHLPHLYYCIIGSCILTK